MIEKILPVIIAVIAMQFLIRFMQKKRSENKSTARDYDYKKKIDQFMKVSNYDEGVGNDRILTDEIRSGLGKPDLLLGIPDSMREIRKELNLIIDGVTYGVRSKIGKNPVIEVKYKDPEKMFDEIVQIIKKHKLS
jgi:hypothetical protein